MSRFRFLTLLMTGVLLLAGCGPTNAVTPPPHDPVATQKAQEVISQQEADYQKLRANVVGGEVDDSGIDPVTGTPVESNP